MKPEYRIRDAYIDRTLFEDQDGVQRWYRVLYGMVGPRTLRRTSPIVNIEGDRVETENSIYMVDSWQIREH